jgi:hypothetical protein
MDSPAHFITTVSGRQKVFSRDVRGNHVQTHQGKVIMITHHAPYGIAFCESFIYTLANSSNTCGAGTILPWLRAVSQPVGEALRWNRFGDIGRRVS